MNAVVALPALSARAPVRMARKSAAKPVAARAVRRAPRVPSAPRVVRVTASGGDFSARPLRVASLAPIRTTRVAPPNLTRSPRHAVLPSPQATVAVKASKQVRPRSPSSPQTRDFFQMTVLLPPDSARQRGTLA